MRSPLAAPALPVRAINTRARAALAIATLAVLAVLTGTAVLATAVPAWAHSYLIASTPAEGETLTELPDAFSVTANETLLDLQSGGGSQGAFGLVVRDAAGGYYGDGCVRVVDATMSTEPTLGASGEYTLLWQVVSSDGHPVSGEISFTWDAPADFVPSEPQPTLPVCGQPAGSDSGSNSGHNSDDPDCCSGESAGGELNPWVIPIAVVLGILALVLAIRGALLHLRKREATRATDTDQSS